MRRAKNPSMNATIIALPSPAEPDLTMLNEAAARVGWKLEFARDLQEFRANPRCRNADAVFLQREAAGPQYSWAEAVRRVRAIAEQARVVVCHGFGETINWDELSEAGAFHALALPFRENEVRQSVGFLWEAENRTATVPEAGQQVTTVTTEHPVTTERRVPHHAWPVRRHAGVRAAR